MELLISVYILYVSIILAAGFTIYLVDKILTKRDEKKSNEKPSK